MILRRSELLIHLPPSYQSISVFSMLFLTCMLGLLYFGTATEKLNVRGYVNVVEGITAIYSQQAGTIKKIYVQEGDLIKKGQKLCMVDLLGDKNELTRIQKMRRSLMIRRDNLATLLHEKEAYLQQLSPLMEKKYIARSFYEAKMDEIAQLKSQHRQVIETMLQYQHTGKKVIFAPISGHVSNILLHQGQYASIDKPLMTLFPKNPTYQVDLYIPVEKAQFLNMSSPVIFQYDPFPYRQFGVGKGKLVWISDHAMTDKDEEKLILLQTPYYKAVANMESASILVSGKSQTLKQGTTLTAVISGHKKRLWEYLLT